MSAGTANCGASAGKGRCPVPEERVVSVGAGVSGDVDVVRVPSAVAAVSVAILSLCRQPSGHSRCSLRAGGGNLSGSNCPGRIWDHSTQHQRIERLSL